MRCLIVEDEFVSRRVLARFLQPLGDVDVAVDGEEAVEAIEAAHKDGAPYHLVCLDVLMPKLDGHQVLERVRQLERERGVAASQVAKVIMVTALSDPKTVMAAFRENVDAFLVKPLQHDRLMETLRKVGLLEGAAVGKDERPA